MEIFLKGNYKSFTKVLVSKSSKKTSNILINIHGLYGLSGDPRSKSKYLARIIAKTGLANVVLLNSSRDWDIAGDGDFEKQKKAFGEKTFEQELQDAKDLMDLIIDQSTYLFGIQKDKLKIFLIGNSLGGTISTCLDEYFKYVKKIVLAGSGTRTALPSKLSEKQILNKASNFKGEVMLLQGSKDEVVPLKAGDLLISAYKNAKTSKVVIKEASHNFSNARKEYVDTIVKFLKK